MPGSLTSCPVNVAVGNTGVVLRNLRYKSSVQRLLSKAGIEVNGHKPWDIKVNNDKFYPRVLARASLGLGESYMESWWECDRLDQFFHKVLSANLEGNFRTLSDLSTAIQARLLNLQNPSRAFLVGKKHYDIGNDLFRQMLDKRMIYSCGYWQNANSLDEAQEAKLDLIAKKLNLREGVRVLDIGCGWGGAARFFAERYAVEVVGITVSRKQVKLAKKTCAGLPVEIRLQDYRDLNEKFDHIYSVGMFEHVGYKNYSTYFKVINRNLNPEGLFLLHTIGGNSSSVKTDPWISKYIFPNSMLPSAVQIARASEGKMVLEDWHNFGAYYDRTLMEWYKNFHNNWDKIKDRYDSVFYRKWCYYLLSCAGSFRARKNQLWQCVFSPTGLPGGYRSVR